MNSENKVVTFAEEKSTGFWSVSTGDGEILFKDKEIQPGLNWLNNNNYAALPDGEHFMKVR